MRSADSPVQLTPAQLSQVRGGRPVDFRIICKPHPFRLELRAGDEVIGHVVEPVDFR